MIQALIVTALLAGGPYVSVKGGVSHLENHELHFEEHTYDKGFGVSGAAGYDFGWFRTEAEILHTRNRRGTVYNLDKSFKYEGNDRVSRTFFFINAFLDVPIWTRLEFYMGAGYGFPRYQLMGGLKYGLTDHWGLDLGYRFVHEPYDAREYTTHPVLGNICGEQPNGVCSGPEEVYENHILTIGLTYNF